MSYFSPRDIMIGLCSHKEFPFWFVRTVAEGIFGQPEADWRNAFLKVSQDITEGQREQEWKRIKILRERFKNMSLEKWVGEGRATVTKLSLKGLNVTTFFDKDYPKDFLVLDEPPSVLWSTRPLMPFFAKTRLSVVGSRRLTYYGERATKVFVKRLVGAYGLTIVSGCARGADWLAHQTALSSGGWTIGFLGCGIEQMTGASRSLSQQERAVVVSEFPPMAPTDKWRFPFRNRLIAAAAKGVLVIEAGERSGTLITTAAAARQNKEVMVLTQPWDSPNAYVFRQLSRDGARVVVRAEDVLEQLGLPFVPDLVSSGIEGVLTLAATSAERLLLQELIRWGGRSLTIQLVCPANVDQKEWEMGRLSLEARGVIRERLGVCELSCMIQS